MSSTFSLARLNEAALSFHLLPPAQIEQQRRLWAFADFLQQQNAVAEVVVGMNNLTVFACNSAHIAALSELMETSWHTIQAADYQGKHIEIPVQYGGEFGMDLAEVAEFHGITPEEVIARHTAPIYTVFMMGFQAGFPYLGGLPEHLHTPRRAVPRTQIAAGSVGIGGSQTGVYPFASPAGWQILGRTLLPLFDAQQSPPTLLSAGDTVQFVAEKVIL
ncbi:MAG: 5-oxoprolinase subunit PxpB [Neisseria sp.]|nr:5-oxoprolinase subunit PxpB [Neisseria sp.]